MSLTLKDLEAAWGKVKPSPGPKIDEDTLLFATLDCFALHGDKLAELEELVDKDIYWSEFMDEAGMEETISILNPPEFEMPKPEFKLPKPRWASMMWQPVFAPGMIITGIV